MNARLLIALGIVVLIANIVCGGEYQRAIDGKSLVWNNDPKPQDAAAWSGKTDKEGYATGYGTLVWYRVERAKVTGSNMPAEKRIPISSYSGKMVRGKLNGAVIAADPSGKFYHGTFANGRRTNDWIAGAPPAHRAESVEPASPAEGPAREKPQNVQSTGATPPQEEPQNRAEQPMVDSAPTPVPASAAPKVSDSLQSLIAPPSSLRTEIAAGPSPVTSVASAEATPPNAGEAAINAADVVAIADQEARARGYNLDEYQRPQAQHATENEAWSVSYEPKIGTAKRFTVTVDQKTKKAELKK